MDFEQASFEFQSSRKAKPEGDNQPPYTKILLIIAAVIIFLIIYSKISTDSEAGKHQLKQNQSSGQNVTQDYDEYIKYIKIIKPSANIRSASSSDAEIVAQAVEGNIFEVQGMQNDWYEIYLFSGEPRYIHKSVCIQVDNFSEYPQNEDLKRHIFFEMVLAEDKAQHEADKKSIDLDENIDYGRILNDRYKLQVFNKYGVQPSIYNQLKTEGVKKKWSMPSF